MEKYGLAAKSVFSLAPYFFIMFIALADHSHSGRKLAVSGLLISMYVCYELKKPGDHVGMNPAIEFVEKYRKHPRVLSILGEEMTSKATIH